MTADPTWKGFALDADTALALLDWQREMGVDEPIGDAPLDRYAEAAQSRPAPAQVPAATSAPLPPDAASDADLPALAATLASRAASLPDLAATMERFDGLDIRKGARSFVFADGSPAARVMIVGDIPDEDEDRAGRPFAGRAGAMLDRMLAAIGLSRDAVDAERAVYLTTALPWRTPGGRLPSEAEVLAMRPFLERHVELAAPEILILMGNCACHSALGRSGVMRMRGAWTTAFGRPAMPMAHPSYLLANAAAKRDAWADLLEIAARLNPQDAAQP